MENCISSAFLKRTARDPEELEIKTRTSRDAVSHLRQRSAEVLSKVGLAPLAGNFFIYLWALQPLGFETLHRCAVVSEPLLLRRGYL